MSKKKELEETLGQFISYAEKEGIINHLMASRLFKFVKAYIKIIM